MFFAEGEGFEPSVPAKVHTLSRRANSATLAPVLKFKVFYIYLKIRFTNIVIKNEFANFFKFIAFYFVNVQKKSIKIL